MPRPPSMPKAEKQVELYPSMRAAAAALKLDVAMLKEAKNAGCPAFDAANRVKRQVLLDWLAKERIQQEAEEVSEDDLAFLDDDNGEGEGVGRAFKSLERYERQARRALSKAISGKKGAVVIKMKEEAWLKVLRELLRYDLSVEMSKRDSGELIPRSQVVEMIRAFLDWHKIGLSDVIRSAVPRIVGLTKAVDVAAVLDPIIRESQALALDVGSKSGLLPTWMADAANRR